MWRYSLTPGLISFGPTRVFGGVTGNKVIEFSVKEAAYTWERYSLNITYLWGRYSIAQESTKYYVMERASSGNTAHYAVSPNLSFQFAKNRSYSTTSPTVTFSNFVTRRLSSYANKEAYVSALNSSGIVGSFFTTIETRHDAGTHFILTGIKTSSSLSYDPDASYYDRPAKFYQFDEVSIVGGGGTYRDDIALVYDTWRLNYDRTETADVRGSRIDQVSSTSSSAYPSNGKSGDYWYTSEGSNTARGNYIDDVTSQNYNQYPDNGISGSYWYIRK